MKFKKLLILLVLSVAVAGFTISSVSAVKHTENVKISSSNSNEYDVYLNDVYFKHITKTTTKNFIITHTIKYTKRVSLDSEESSTEYLTLKAKNPKVKIKSIQVKLANNGLKIWKWKTYKINANSKTIKLGKNERVQKFHLEGMLQTIYKINY